MGKSIEIKIMLRSKLFAGFSEKECEELCAELMPALKELEAGSVILSEGEAVKWIGIVHKGKLMGMKFYYEGTANLFHIYEPWEAVNVAAVSSAFKTSPLTLITDRSAEVLFVSAGDSFCKVANKEYRDRLKDNMLHILADENIKLLYKTEILSKKSLRDRIMAYLMIIREKRASDSFHIMMNREQFAQYLCVNRSALSHELANMQREGIISFDKDFFAIVSTKERLYKTEK